MVTVVAALRPTYFAWRAVADARAFHDAAEFRRQQDEVVAIAATVVAIGRAAHGMSKDSAGAMEMLLARQSQLAVQVTTSTNKPLRELCARLWDIPENDEPDHACGDHIHSEANDVLVELDIIVSRIPRPAPAQRQSFLGRLTGLDNSEADPSCEHGFPHPVGDWRTIETLLKSRTGADPQRRGASSPFRRVRPRPATC